MRKWIRRGLRGSGIYAIVCKLNGMAYIGSTKDFNFRAQRHVSDLRRKRHYNPHLQSAWDKYGEENFDFIILEYIDDLSVLEEKEQYWITEYAKTIELYNYSPVAVCSIRGRPIPQYVREKISRSHLGMKHTDEQRRKISESNKGKPGPWLGKKRPEETRKKISAARMGHTVSDTVRQKVSEANSRPYPSFRNRITNGIIPAGVNLKKLCRELGIHDSGMWAVISGRAKSYKGWKLNR